MQCCRPNKQLLWFNAAVNNDLPTLKQLPQEFANSVEQRDNLPFFQGFCAIHYAIVSSSYTALQYLLPFEAEAVTQQPAELGILTLGSNSNVMHLVFATNDLKSL